jgi:hypothetical protein
MIEWLFAFIFVMTILMFIATYLSLRYRPTEHHWLILSQDEVRRLKEEHERYAWTHVPTQPTGRPLYKRRMFSTDGMTIYENGIFAKFSIGRTASYRFVPFNELSGIYPVRTKMPPMGTTPLFPGLPFLDTLQIETESGMVYFINPMMHRLENVLPILQRAMMGWWEKIYHPEETIGGEFVESSLLVHKSIREKRGGLPPSREKPPKPPIMSPYAGKGVLLLEESEDEVRERTRPYLIWAAILIPVGLCIIVPTWFLMSYLPISGFFLLTAIMVGFLPLVIGLGFLGTSRIRTPIRIYENGIDVPMGGRTIFVSYGEFTGMREQMNPIEKEMYIHLEGTTPYQRVGLRKNMRGLEKILDSIISKIGKQEYVIEVERTPQEEARARRFEYAMYATGPTAMVILMVMFYFLIGPSLFYSFAEMFLLLPLIAMVITAIIPFFLKPMKKMLPRKLNLKVPAGIVVGLLVFFFILVFVGEDILKEVYEPSEHIGPRPSWSDITPAIYDGGVFNITRDILVDSGETLHVRNSTIEMNLASDKDFGIWIAEGGTLILENTTVDSTSPDLGYTFEIMGSATITGSYISGLWGDPEYENYDGGLEIYSDDVLIEDSHIQDPPTNGLLIMNSNPSIINNSIEHASDDGIEMRNSDAQILSNRIERCGWAMIVSDGSNALIRGNLISNNLHGIAILESDPIVDFNEFVGNSNYAILIDENSYPIVEDNVFATSDQDIEEIGFSFFGGEICMITTITVAVICLLMLHRAHKDSLKSDVRNVR